MHMSFRVLGFLHLSICSGNGKVVASQAAAGGVL